MVPRGLSAAGLSTSLANTNEPFVTFEPYEPYAMTLPLKMAHGQFIPYVFQDDS